MLFNSFAFIFCFLPITAVGFFILGRWSRTAAAAWLLVASLVFYAWWDIRYLILLGASILVNFCFGLALSDARRTERERRVRMLLAVAVVANLVVLGYYKYANFFLGALATATGWHAQMATVVLPLGISFFTFTQIAYLVDCSRGMVREANLIYYALFVTYFPHLIAGPVLHHGEMMPQFARPTTYRPTAENFAVGLTIFFIGLFKKVVIADGIAPHVAPVFSAAAAGQTLTMLEANGGALSYAFQLYFDFSGYSDMAIGLSRIFGITLPLNFNSPYKAVNIIDFWRRWHMTLSRFLRDYLYIALGGNRLGKVRRYLNLILTMVLGGLWHGAAWTFVVWGTVHGALLVLNHGWHTLKLYWMPNFPHKLAQMLRPFSILLTFYAVIIAWVFFRANSLDTAVVLVKAMAGYNGIVWPAEWKPVLQTALPWSIESWSFRSSTAFVALPPFNWLTWLFALVWLLPNTQQFMNRYRPALGVSDDGSRCLLWHPHVIWALVISMIALLALMQMFHVSEFLYFQF
jgi:D-alanyl-lipoteichoic acid acyltransferase DltB (MBOAT superfamily)